MLGDIELRLGGGIHLGVHDGGVGEGGNGVVALLVEMREEVVVVGGG
jgi:hypothetical protein